MVDAKVDLGVGGGSEGLSCALEAVCGGGGRDILHVSLGWIRGREEAEVAEEVGRVEGVDERISRHIRSAEQNREGIGRGVEG